MDKRKFPKVRVGAGTPRYKIEQLEQVLQQKNRQLAKLQKTNQVLTEREQVVAHCINQQVDLLQVLGKLAFSLPQPNDAAYEAKATAAVEALLKDMEVAQLMQAADSITTSKYVDSESTQQLGWQPHQQQEGASQQEASQQQQESSSQQQQQQPDRQEPWTIMIMRSFLQSPECMQTLRRMSAATVQELAGIIHKEMIELGFAVARYPSKAYMGDAAVAALQDPLKQRLMQAANKQLHAAINALGRTILLLHVVQDKVLNLSMLNLETLEVEAPPGSFWEEVAAKLTIPQAHMAQLHTGFLIYNSKRTELTGQMQQTMTQLQQLLKPLVQDQHEQQPTADTQQQVGDACPRSSSNSSSESICKPVNGSTVDTAVRVTSHQGSTPDMLECMEDADRLLQQLSRQVWSLREASRCLIFHFANVVDPLTMSLASVHSWPYIMQPPPIVEVLVKQEVARQQQEREETDADDDEL